MTPIVLGVLRSKVRVTLTLNIKMVSINNSNCIGALVLAAVDFGVRGSKVKVTLT
jgi:hypothetical protein